MECVGYKKERMMGKEKDEEETRSRRGEWIRWITGGGGEEEEVSGKEEGKEKSHQWYRINIVSEKS